VANPPPTTVIEAFGTAGAAVRLSGGRGDAWRVGHLVLRPVDGEEPPLAWQEDVLGSISCEGVRVALPQRARDGAFDRDGWCAWHFVEGQHEERRWEEIIAVGELFHRALVDVPEPDFIAERGDPWAIGDRVAWEEFPAERFEHVKHLSVLVDAQRPFEAADQLVHGDLTGNVLFAAGLPPAVIDFSPFWRPAGYASAIVVADALVWEGADATLLDAVAHIEDFDQLLVRALIMRAVVDRLFREHDPVRPDDADEFLPAVELACRLAAST
jgi:uncharacterized protein (TIGR02569 family)